MTDAEDPPAMGVLDEMQEAIGAARERVGPSVVGLGRGWGRGSGVVIAEGRVLTNAHVLRGEEVAITRGGAAGGRGGDAGGDATGDRGGEAAGDATGGRGGDAGAVGGDVVAGRVVGFDADLDVAVIEADTGDAPPVAWDPALVEALAPGQAVIALADPGGRGLRASLGFVTATGRSFRGPRGRRIGGSIEHSAPLPRGSSGGPLVDVQGRLLGINSVRMEGGLLLALPADRALAARVEALGRGEAPTRPRLGLALAPPRAARRMRAAVGLPPRDGLLVRGVEEGSPGAAAGLQRGDLLVAAAGRPLGGYDDLFDALDGAEGELVLTVVRGTDERDVTAHFS